MEYNHKDIEQKWRSYWGEHKVFRVSNDTDKPKYYVLDMFPYPSGAGLHVGHPLGYIASDIIARYKRMKGFNVLHPMGFDAFGLPAEQYALQTGVHPADSTAENIVRYRSQLENIGFDYDWDRSVQTCDPAYYRWTQWIFLQLFHHYYDKAEDGARPIEDLIRRFEAEGNTAVQASTTQETPFTAEDWHVFSSKEKDDVLMNYRLAYRKIGYVNWCEALGTVLANDEVKDGLSERGGFPVERKAMRQWSLRITAYAERLLNDLDTVDWPESLKLMQRNWIGRSEGGQLFFDVVDSDAKIEIYTTRPDTIFGATFMVLAPEHELVDALTTDAQREAMQSYIQSVENRSNRDRQATGRKMTGVFIGRYAINPFTKQHIPIWISDYVLKEYGTGAIMSVPSDDDRDRLFAETHDLPIIDVIDKSDHPGAGAHDKVGRLINSDFLNGMEVPEAIEATLRRIEAMRLGRRQVNYKLRDANYSRQRYWGEPFPIFYDGDEVAHAMSEEDLPLELPPLDDFKPASGGRSPLARLSEWVKPSDGVERETDTMPGFAGSSWYFLRYMDAHNDEAFASPEAIAYWRDVDLYIGGTEHAVGHLMYARFWHKFLYDKKLVPTVEPFKKLINQGMIQGTIEFMYLQKEKVDGFNRFLCAGLVDHNNGPSDFAKIPVHIDFVQDYGSSKSYLNIESIKKFVDWRPEFENAIFECAQGIYHKGVFRAKDGKNDSRLFTVSEVGKMSKRYFNVVNPDDVVAAYGADCFRMYEMFLGPIEQSKPWDTKGIDGVSRFLRKYWTLFFDGSQWIVDDETPSREAWQVLHATIKKVSDDIERFSFNTAVSQFMVCVNDLKKMGCRQRAILEVLNRTLAPFAPFITEEIHHRLGGESSVHRLDYPIHDEQYLTVSTVDYPLCVNGKKRAMASFSVDASKADIEREALANEAIRKWIDGKEVVKVIVVPNRMVNIVVKGA